MVVEQFKDGKARAVYERSQQRGRMMPDGLEYIDSWVDEDVTRCFQLMRTTDATLFAQWTSHWEDLVDFEIIPVISGSEARAKVLG